ncbi:unnamed protein product [Somion occarium]|uniref:Cytochrome c oxidase assembly factor 3 n=1 Tax=Somion occarium TaxID=3059160 RepID=A0ABP1D0P7_9APHY
MADPYIDRKTVNKSYRPRGDVMSPGLKRAREPFRIRNALTGVVLASFAVGVWAYSLSAVKQDDFSDVDEEAKALASSSPPSTSNVIPATPEVVNATKGAIAAGFTPLEPAAPSPVVPAPASSSRPKGVLAALLADRYPQALDPSTKTIIFGAPPVDNPGRLRDWWKQGRR